MKSVKLLLAIAIACCLTAGVTSAQSTKPQPKQTCCEKAFAEGKECKNKCCIAAHRQGKSCEKCNPGKQDLEVMKKLAAKKKQPQK